VDDTVERRLDPTMLASLLGSGLPWLVVLAPMWPEAIWLFLIAGAYVVAGSVAMSMVRVDSRPEDGRDIITVGLLWLADVGIWIGISVVGTVPTGGLGELGWALAIGVWLGLCIGTPAFIVWQLVAFFLRGFRWRRPLGADVG